MKFEELKRKANKGEIKLEDLDTEDILKFLTEGFPNPTLASNFNITEKEVKSIRRRKKLNDADFENTVRNIILLYDYIIDNYKISREFFSNYIVMAIAGGFGIARGKYDLYIKKSKNIDWINMDPKEEIKKRKIDIEFRRMH